MKGEEREGRRDQYILHGRREKREDGINYSKDSGGVFSSSTTNPFVVFIESRDIGSPCE